MLLFSFANILSLGIFSRAIIYTTLQYRSPVFPPLENILLQLSLLEILVTPYSISETTAELYVPGTYRFTGDDLEFEVFCHSMAVKNAINALLSE